MRWLTSAVAASPGWKAAKGVHHRPEAGSARVPALRGGRLAGCQRLEPCGGWRPSSRSRWSLPPDVLVALKPSAPHSRSPLPLSHFPRVWGSGSGVTLISVPPQGRKHDRRRSATSGRGRGWPVARGRGGRFNPASVQVRRGGRTA